MVNLAEGQVQEAKRATMKKKKVILGIQTNKMRIGMTRTMGVGKGVNILIHENDKEEGDKTRFPSTTVEVKYQSIIREGISSTMEGVASRPSNENMGP
ncbi:hypothetical protein VNO78_25456 [Psophocarpus tetragonolobus]|uniref:Uncharacterized protein n=1 Tax=Psophocarpus tetragonolobus TaxID=3891 RepID=A0AAN9S759_PSOTE